MKNNVIKFGKSEMGATRYFLEYAASWTAKWVCGIIGFTVFVVSWFLGMSMSDNWYSLLPGFVQFLVAIVPVTLCIVGWHKFQSHIDWLDGAPWAHYHKW